MGCVHLQRRQDLIDEAYEGRIGKFQVQCHDGQGWQTVVAGTTVGRNFTKVFSPVTAGKVRLQILEATDGPTIWEFQVAAPATH